MASKYSSNEALCHRSACKIDYKPMENEMYTMPSVIHKCKDDGWMPVLGGVLKCLPVENEFVGVVYNDQVVGLVPKKLTSVFKSFLHHGPIFARCMDAIVYGDFGYLIPADYIFHGSRENLHRLISELQDSENSADMNSILLQDSVDILSDYAPPEKEIKSLEVSPQKYRKALPATEYKLYPTRRCI